MSISSSFLFHKMIKYWDFERNIRKPSLVSINSHELYHFVCENKHNFMMSTHNITKISLCPFCHNFHKM